MQRILDVKGDDDMSIARFVRVWRPAFAAALIAAVAAALLPGPASAAPPYAFDDPAHPSAVSVTGALPFLATIYGTDVEVMCVTIVNKGPRPATRIGLSLAALDAAGTVGSLPRRTRLESGWAIRRPCPSTT